MKNSDLGPTINTLKTEVDFLGGELTAARAEIARLRAGGCARDQGTTQYCAEAASFAELFAGARDALAEVNAENERLRAALEEVRVLVFGANHSEARYPLARAALEGRT